ncbi:hypothetical protein BDN67DRAFT_984982 [Paxillus ammoniavirescens]|nr:hypothetical protein BDN67DRAFT_984982 [Paxillus ammoniavirescens]
MSRARERDGARECGPNQMRGVRDYSLRLALLLQEIVKCDYRGITVRDPSIQLDRTCGLNFECDEVGTQSESMQERQREQRERVPYQFHLGAYLKAERPWMPQLCAELVTWMPKGARYLVRQKNELVQLCAGAQLVCDVYVCGMLESGNHAFSESGKFCRWKVLGLRQVKRVLDWNGGEIWKGPCKVLKVKYEKRGEGVKVSSLQRLCMLKFCMELSMDLIEMGCEVGSGWY